MQPGVRADVQGLLARFQNGDLPPLDLAAMLRAFHLTRGDYEELGRWLPPEDGIPSDQADRVHWMRGLLALAQQHAPEVW